MNAKRSPRDVKRKIKVILYLSTTINGCIAEENDDVWFVSKSSWKSFEVLSKRAGNIIMGRRTYELSKVDGTYPYKDRVNLVVTRNSIRGVTTFKSPKATLDFLESSGFKLAFVAGGSKLAASFLAENLIDDLYLDLEPVILGRGISVFAKSSFHAKLRLVGTKKLSQDELQLHYKVH